MARASVGDRDEPLRLQRIKPAHHDSLSHGDELGNGYASPYRGAERNPHSDSDAVSHGHTQRDAERDSKRDRHHDSDAERDAEADLHTDDYTASRLRLRLR